MSYNPKPKMILFDVGGTLFADEKCNPATCFENHCHYATYLCNQLECEFGGERCFGIASNMDFLLVCTYEENGESPELLICKKR